MSRWARTAEKIRINEERIFGITKLKLQAFSLVALEMSLGDIVVKVTSMVEKITTNAPGEHDWVTSK